jgi:fumarylacetoacetase
VLLHEAADCVLHLPARIGDFTDFFAGIHHAYHRRPISRPDNPLMPNYKYVPVAYHSRASSVRPSGGGAAAERPAQAAEQDRPISGHAATSTTNWNSASGSGRATNSGAHPDRRGRPPCRRLLPAQRLVGARHPGLGIRSRSGRSWPKAFHPPLSRPGSSRPRRWRPSAWNRPPARPAIRTVAASQRCRDQAHGGFDIAFEVLLLTPKMRAAGAAPHVLSRSNAACSIGPWRRWSRITPRTAATFEPGDLFGSGTVSAPTPGSEGCLLEMTPRRPQSSLPAERGDSYLSARWRRGHLPRHRRRDGYAPIGFGECRGRIVG